MGCGTLPSSDFMPHSGRAALFPPSGAPGAGSWFCASNANVTDGAIQSSVDIQGLGALGSCASGTPVSGSITVCDALVASTGRCAFSRSGTLDGTTLTSADWSDNQSAQDAHVAVAYPDGMIISYTRIDPSNSSGALANAFVLLSDGTIYCAGPSSSFTFDQVEPGGHRMDTLTDFRKLSGCASVTPAGNSVSGCLGFNE